MQSSQFLAIYCLRLLPYRSQPAKRARLSQGLAFAASDAKAYLTAVDTETGYIITRSSIRSIRHQGLSEGCRHRLICISISGYV